MRPIAVGVGRFGTPGEWVQWTGVSSLPSPPSVSVIIPAYNVSRYIAQTVGSVLSQTFRKYEIIVVNDGSPDTEDLEHALEPYRSQVVYLKQPNGGPSNARNTGVRHARGEYVAFLDGDDLWVPEFLATQMRALHQDPSLDLIYSNAGVIRGTRQATWSMMDQCPSEGQATLENLLAERCNIFTSSVVVRRSAVLDVGGFDETFLRAEDFDLWIRLARSGKRIAYHRQRLIWRRLTDDGLTSDPTALLEGAVQVLRKTRSCAGLTPDLITLIDARMAHHEAAINYAKGKACMFAGQYRQAEEHFQRLSGTYAGAKARAIILCLRISPSLARRCAGLWRTILTARIALSWHSR